MMEELVRQVAERTGISEEQARTAVTTVLGFVKERLPEPIAGQVESALSGQPGEGGGLGSLGGALGGMFGKGE
jgi:uncharacterized protein (DUF2267 family)